MKRLICIILIMLTLAGCMVSHAAPASTSTAETETGGTAARTASTEAVTTEPLPTEPAETTEAPAPPVLEECVGMVLLTPTFLSPARPQADITLVFPRVELPEGDRSCSLTLTLDGEPLVQWDALELFPGLKQGTRLDVSFSLRDQDRTARLEAVLRWQDQSLTREAEVLLDNDEPEVYYAASGEDRPYSIDVLRNHNVVIVYGKEEEGYTFPVKVWLCSTGYTTPRGNYSLGSKREWGSLFGGVYGQYVCGICGDILFHSVPYSRKQKDSLKTEEYNKLGSVASMGCVRLPVEGAKWIFDYCPSGTPVHIYDAQELPVERPEPLLLDPEDPRSGWDPTDPDPENPWNVEDGPLTVDLEPQPTDQPIDDGLTEQN